MSFALAGALLGGCAGGSRSTADYDAPEAKDCAAWFARADAEAQAAGVRDAQDRRVAGFPYLRVNRLLASLREEARQSERALQALAERMQALDLEARRHEIANVPDARVPATADASGSPSRSLALRRAESCARLLREIDLARPERRAALLERAAVPDDEPVASRGVRGEQDEVRERVARGGGASAGANLIRYAPPPVSVDREAVAGVLARAAENPLGIPEPAPREMLALFAAYAPTFEVQLGDDFDRFGELRLRRGSRVPVIDSSFNTVYVNLAWTRYQGRVLLQLVYTIWFPAPLDGLIWRVTLGPGGEPLLYDSMHAYGGLHAFFPTPAAEPRPGPGGEAKAFVPQRLPAPAPGERPLVRVATRTHGIDQVSFVAGTDSLVRYEMHLYDEVRSLTDFSGARRSVFGEDARMPGSLRDARQWGHQATGAGDRRHFDDADLIERRFALALPVAR